MKTLLRPLELFLRHALVYPLLRLLFRNPSREEAIHPDSVQKILILRYDRIGDIIVTTPIFQVLKSLNPRFTIGVLASAANAELIRHHPDVDRIHVLSSQWFKLLRMIREARNERYDLVLNFIFNRTTSGGVLANLIAPKGVKIGQGAEQYRFYFNRLLRLPRGDRHMVEILAGYVEEVFGRTIDRNTLSFTIALNEEDRTRPTTFLRKHNLGRMSSADKSRSFVVLNISATDRVRRITPRQSAQIVEFLTGPMNVPVVIISGPDDDPWRKKLVQQADRNNVHTFPEMGRAHLREIAALIEEAALVVTPDTSIIHVSSAMNTPVLGLFTPLQVTSEWLPWGVKHSIILADAGQPVSAIPAARIENELRKFGTAVLTS